MKRQELTEKENKAGKFDTSEFAADLADLLRRYNAGIGVQLINAGANTLVTFIVLSPLQGHRSISLCEAYAPPMSAYAPFVDYYSICQLFDL